MPLSTFSRAVRYLSSLSDYERLTFTTGQVLDAEGLRGRAFSASYAPPDAAARAGSALKAIMAAAGF